MANGIRKLMSNNKVFLQDKIKYIEFKLNVQQHSDKTTLLLKTNSLKLSL